jgi:hypothetical protein
VSEVAHGGELAAGRATMPDSWIDLLADDPADRDRMRRNEWKKDW